MSWIKELGLDQKKVMEMVTNPSVVDMGMVSVYRDKGHWVEVLGSEVLDLLGSHIVKVSGLENYSLELHEFARKRSLTGIAVIFTPSNSKMVFDACEFTRINIIKGSRNYSGLKNGDGIKKEGSTFMSRWDDRPSFHSLEDSISVECSFFSSMKSITTYSELLKRSIFDDY